MCELYMLKICIYVGSKDASLKNANFELALFRCWLMYMNLLMSVYVYSQCHNMPCSSQVPH